MKNITTHPITQLFFFFIVMVNGKEWDALPFGWLVAFGSGDGQSFGIVGVVAILITLISIFWKRNFTQPLGLLIMWCSIAAFFWQTSPTHKSALFRGGLPMITLLLFIAVSVMVLNARLKWKNF